MDTHRTLGNFLWLSMFCLTCQRAEALSTHISHLMVLPIQPGGLTCQFSWSGWPWRCAPGVSSPACGLVAQKGAGPPARSPAGTAPGAGQAGLAGRPASLLRTAGARLVVERGKAHQRPTKTPCPAPSKPLSLCPFLGPVGHLLLKNEFFVS